MATAQEREAMIEDANQEVTSDTAVPLEKTYLLLRLSPEFDRTIEELMERTHLPKAEFLNMAVGFLKAAADAIAAGKHAGIADNGNDLEIEFTGL